ncbi:putative glutamine amidotransferase class-I [Paenibacillus algicola]|uniref:Imidazole glycerol phosphate synthase subunit HisH n=1 Tax=Paenibacillus algicola TaxID=2565926 RepID=A0A4P8XIS1_9BACL|nr:imidazole glycerol phosphate synthase subunit HisH [Paenibacillus algicola]QCT01400.1 putative glutamine amidotransferase class-I [Paenibacillus algicola]
MKIGIIDYGAGNLHSVSNALKYLGYNIKFITAESDFTGFDKLIFPGVGNARKTMELLNNSGMEKLIICEINKGIPLLGICLGMQLLLDYSEEGGTDSLGVIEGHTERFRDNIKVPHIGWNQVEAESHYIFKGIPNKTYYYFVHSYFASTINPKETVGVTEYGNVRYSSVISKDNVVGVQFHPEKSGECGLLLLNNFCGS